MCGGAQMLITKIKIKVNNFLNFVKIKVTVEEKTYFNPGFISQKQSVYYSPSWNLFASCKMQSCIGAVQLVPCW